MQKHLKQQLDTISKTFKSYNDEGFEELKKACLKIIASGGRIIATALGKNVPICEKFIGTLNSLSIDAHFLNTNSAIHGDLGLVKNNDLVIILSKSGETDETIYLSKLLRARRMTNNWLLTCSRKSTVEKLVKNIIVLPVEQEGDPWNLVPNNSTIVFLIFLQALAMTLLEEIDVSISIFKKNHPGGAIGKTLRKKKI